MVTIKVAKLIQRVGFSIALVGSAFGLAVWLLVFKGDLSRPSIQFLWPMDLGWAIALIGWILERFAKQPDVGRQI
jgi:cytochrome bd-type quinol oxidase subunit 1